jgi:hypothetical protein
LILKLHPFLPFSPWNRLHRRFAALLTPEP